MLPRGRSQRSNQNAKVLMMQMRKLGNSGLEIAPLMFGGNVFGWTADEATSFTLLDAFVAAGFNVIDTADVYSRWVPGHNGGESETVIGNWLKAARRPRQGHHRHQGRHGDAGRRTRACRSPTSCRRSRTRCKRLQTDYIDLYQSHTDDKDTPLEETLEAYDRADQAGQGARDRRLQLLRAAAGGGARRQRRRKLPRYESLQPHYNLYRTRRLRARRWNRCAERAHRRDPLLLAGQRVPDRQVPHRGRLQKSPRGGGIKKMLNARGLSILKALDDVSARMKANPAQVALAWLIARPSITAPIASATNLDQLKDLIAAVHLKLDADAIKTLDTASR